MVVRASFAHVNLVAHDGRRLARFYRRVFGCADVGTPRDLSGPDLVRGTHVPGAHLFGVHLRLPGLGKDGPTIEVFQYEPRRPRMRPAANRPGYGHLAFHVKDVRAAVRAVVRAGGRRHGDVVTTLANGRPLTWVYVADPEGNLIELQQRGAGG